MLLVVKAEADLQIQRTATPVLVLALMSGNGKLLLKQRETERGRRGWQRKETTNVTKY